MGTKLYVGNLSFNTTETDLQDLFAQAGAVQDVMKDAIRAAKCRNELFALGSWFR